MEAIDTGRLLGAWEQGQTQHPLHRALTLLRAGTPELTIDSLASLPVGERDWRLIELRRRIFGSRFDAVAACPGCGEKLELGFSAAELPERGNPPLTIEVMVDGRNVAVRLPNTADLLEVASEAPERRVPALLARCAGEELSGSAAETVQLKMAEIDPAAGIELDLTCPGCDHHWTGFFDIASYLWTELNDYAARLLRETHTLARAYSWNEADILALSPRRRQVYLDLVMGT